MMMVLYNNQIVLLHYRYLSMSKSVKVTTEPYLLIALHAAKYSDHNIFGYLLGTEVGNVTNVTAVLPVCHNAPAGPILEISGQVVSTSLFPIFMWSFNSLDKLLFGRRIK